MTMTRALFCRDLLILQKLYLRFGDNVSPYTHMFCQKKLCSFSICSQ